MDTSPEALPIEEIVRRYPNQWVLVEETTWDPMDIPPQGWCAWPVWPGRFTGPVRAVITTGQSPPSSFIRVSRFLPTSPWCYETPW